MKDARTTITQTERDITFTRIFDAPRDLVFEAFSKSEHIAQWWGPAGWPVVACTIDFRPGGVWHYCLRRTDGQEHWAKAVYREITAPERIVYVDGSSDAQGNDVEGLPPSITTVTFMDLGGKTKLISHIQYASANDLKTVVARGMAHGFTQSLYNLDRYLESQESREEERRDT